MTEGDGDPPGLARALERLRRRYGAHGFDRVATVEAGQMSGEDHPRHFTYVSIFRHRLGTSFHDIGGHQFIVQNGFLTSHAYNLALVWLAAHGGHGATGPMLADLLAHNFKKFFAEVTLDRENVLMGRALLLETLLYEQDLMRPVFDAVGAAPAVDAMARDLAACMSNLTAMHELGHYFLDRHRTEAEATFASLFDGDLGRKAALVRERFGPGTADELVCDGFAAWQALSVEEPGDGRAPADDGGAALVARARMAVFGYRVLADLIGLQRSAEETARAGRNEETRIELGSPIRPKEAFAFTIGRDDRLDARAAWVSALVDGYLAGRGLALFGDDGPFPLAADFGDRLGAAIDGMADVRPGPVAGLTGTDLQRRQLAQLAAEALKDHPDGVQHLLWRSKTFRIGPDTVDP